jgi:hypothetical protein
VVETVSTKAKELAAGAAEMAGYTKDKVQDWASSAAEMGEDAWDSFVGIIRRYPVPALLIGFGLGFLCARALAMTTSSIPDRMGRTSYS